MLHALNKHTSFHSITIFLSPPLLYMCSSLVNSSPLIMELSMLVEEQLQSSLFDCFQDPITSIPPLDANSSYLQSLATDCINVDPDFYLEQHDSISPFPASLEQYCYDDLSDYSLVPLPDLSDWHSDYPLVPLPYSDYPLVPLPDLSDRRRFSPDPPLDLSLLKTLTQECYYINTQLEYSAVVVNSFLLIDNDSCYTQDAVDRSEGRRGIMGRSKSAREISLEEMRGYFYMPITKAAKEMNVGLTVLKKRCRELGIPRWPHRKMKSLRTLISNVRELGKDEDVSRELEALDEYRRRMEVNPEIQFTDRTKKLRQACFKANYKKRRLMQNQFFDCDAVHERMTCQHPSSSSSSCDYHVF